MFSHLIRASFAVIIISFLVVVDWSNILRESSLLIFHPEWSHLPQNPKNFFEGWYFKMNDPKTETAVSIVPGIFVSNSTNNNETHSFVFVVRKGVSHYYRFPISEYKTTQDPFTIKVGNNLFSEKGLTVDLKAKGNPDASSDFSGNFSFSELSRWPISLFSLGAMGFFGYLPLECYHGVLSFDHRVEAHFEETVEGSKTQVHKFKGNGYIEKDWGTNFPTKWIWFQANTFETKGTSVILAYSSLPLFSVTTTDALLAALYHEGEVYRFSLYTLSFPTKLSVNETNVIITVANPVYELSLVIERGEYTVLLGPKSGNGGKMEKYVEESISSNASVRLKNRITGELIFKGYSTHGGLEVCGKFNSF